MAFTARDVLRALRSVVDPERDKDIVRLNMVRNLTVEDDVVSFTVILKSPTAPFADDVQTLATTAVRQALGDDLTANVALDNEMIGLGDDLQVSGSGQQQSAEDPTPGVLNTIAVASGKGGVGKSTVAVNLALSLAKEGYDVGLIDTDIYGPSVPTMLGLEGEKPRVSDERKIIPLQKYGLKVLSMGFMIDPQKAVIWRGPMVTKAIRQFLGDTDWGTLDYLVMDLPPGTGDIQLTIVQTVSLTGAVIVSTPQEVALADARKGVSMFDNVNVPVLGIVENMAFFTPPDLPDRKYYLFGQGGARHLARDLDVPFLGEIPIEQAVRESGDDGEPIVAAAPDSASAKAFRGATRHMVDEVALRNAEQPPSQQVEILYR